MIWNEESKMKRYFQTMFGWIVTVAFLTDLAFAQSASAGSEPWRIYEKDFVIGASSVLVPEGVFLLIRKDGRIGAVRFTNIERRGEACIGRASYDSYFQADGSGSFKATNVRKRTGRINLKPPRGPGKLSLLVNFGYPKVRIGDWAFTAYCPNGLYEWPHSAMSQKDYGFEFAGTSAREVEEIDTSDKRLRWFRYDPNNKVILPISDLPK